MKIKTFHEFIEEKYGSISEAGEPPKEELPGEDELTRIVGKDISQRIKNAMFKNAMVTDDKGKNVPQKPISEKPTPQNNIKPPKGK